MNTATKSKDTARDDRPGTYRLVDEMGRTLEIVAARGQWDADRIACDASHFYTYTAVRHGDLEPGHRSWDRGEDLRACDWGW